MLIGLGSPAQMRVGKKGGRKAYADSVKLQLKKLADSVQEIRSRQPVPAGDSLAQPLTEQPDQPVAEKKNRRWVFGAGLIALLILFIYRLARRRREKG